MPSIADLKARLTTLTTRGGNKPKDILKFKDEHEGRFLPAPGRKDPFVELTFHYDLGETVLCPKANFGKQCDACDICEDLKSWKDPKTGRDKVESIRKADWELFKKIQPKARTFAAFVERVMHPAAKAGDKPTFGPELSPEGAKWVGLAPTNVEELFKEIADSDNIEEAGASPGNETDVLFSVDKALDVHVSFKDKAGTPGAKGNQKTFPITEFRARKKASPLSKDPAEKERVLNSVKDIRAVYPEQTSDQVRAILAKWAGNAGSEAKPEGGTEYGEGEKKQAAEKVANGGMGIDEAFEKLAAEKKS